MADKDLFEQAAILNFAKHRYMIGKFELVVQGHLNVIEVFLTGVKEDNPLRGELEDLSAEL